MSSYLPLVSIITPAYNAMPWIQETVQSVVDQDYPHIQHIVIDGGSLDGTEEYLGRQANVLSISEPDRGQSHALNKGFAMAGGDIVGWLNADDVYLPGSIKKVVDFFARHTSVDLVYSDIQVMDDLSERIGVSRSRPYDLAELLVQNFIKQPTVFMRRHVLEKLCGVDETLHYTMDQEFWLRAGLAGIRMHYMQDEILASFRLCSGTKSFDDTPQFRLEWNRVLSGLQDVESERPGFYRQVLVAQRKNIALYHLANTLQALQNGDRRTTMSELLKALRSDASLMLNRGMWKFAGMGIFGMKPDRLQKYRNNT